MKSPQQSEPNGQDGHRQTWQFHHLDVTRDLDGEGGVPMGPSAIHRTAPHEPVNRGHLYGVLQHLRRSKLVQWLLTYLGVAWLSLQLIETLGDIWDLPIMLQRAASLALGLLFFPAAVIAWYHGEQGRQRVCPVEVSLLVVLGTLVGMVLWRCLR
jgi:hypothetical protein